MLSRLSLVTLLLCVGLGASSAQGAGRRSKAAPPKATIEDARSALTSGQFERALALFTELSGSAVGAQTIVQAHLGRGICLAALGRNDDAVEAFGRALQLDPEATLQGFEANPNAEHLLAAAREETKGELRIETTRPVSQVEVDGAFYGPTPLTLSLPVGRHQLRLHPPAARPISREVVVAAGANPLLRVEVPRTTSELAAGAANAPEPGPTPLTATAAPKAHPARRGPWVASGAGVVIAAIGGALLWKANDEALALRAGDPVRLPPARAQQYAREGPTLQAAGVTALCVGAGALALGMVLLGVERPSDTASSGARP